MTEDFKTGLVVVFVGATLAIGAWLGSCAVYVLAAQRWGF